MTEGHLLFQLLPMALQEFLHSGSISPLQSANQVVCRYSIPSISLFAAGEFVHIFWSYCHLTGYSEGQGGSANLSSLCFEDTLSFRTVCSSTSLCDDAQAQGLVHMKRPC